MLRWDVELGRVDILLEVSLMSSYIVCRCIGHMKVLTYIFDYLKLKSKLTIDFDSTFGSEFITVKIAVELLIAFRFTRWCFGIPFDQPTNLLRDNDTVWKNSRSS